jgi:teichuronic acid biosynthesis protein TuaE
MNSLSKISITLKSYTYLLLATALLGVHIISIDLGFIQLSPYRILLILSPFVFLKVKKSTIRQLIESKNYEYFAFMLFWVIYSIIPIVWIKDFSGWVKMYIFLLSGFITTWYIGLYLTSKNDIVNALEVVELLSVVFGAIAIYEIFTGNYLFLNEESLSYYQERSQVVSTIGFRVPISVFGNPNNYSLFLLFSVFGSLGLSKTKNTKPGRLLSLVFTMFFSFLLVATQSRSGFIGLILGFMAYGFILIKRTNAKNIWKFILVIIGTLFFAIPWLIQNKELFEALITINLNATSGSDAVRINLIKNGVHFLVNSFFMGVGLGNIEYYMANYGVYSTGGITNIHNWWMEILVSSGIFVFIFYIYVYLKNLKRLYKFSSFKFDNDMQHLSTVFFSFLSAFFVASVGSSSLMYNEWIWPVLSIAMSFINLYNVKK